MCQEKNQAPIHFFLCAGTSKSSAVARVPNIPILKSASCMEQVWSTSAQKLSRNSESTGNRATMFSNYRSLAQPRRR